MIFRELNHSKCKTYLVACPETKIAALVDPIREKIDRYLALLSYYGLHLNLVIDTHTHADHRTASFELKDLIGAKVLMHRNAPQPHVDIHVDDGDSIEIGKLKAKIFYTPGHTPDSISLYIEDRVLTGDVLLIGGTGRSDFAGGDSGAQFDSITNKLFTLPETTLAFPAHDYRGHTHSTIGEEKKSNPRLAGKTRDEYIQLMSNLNLPLPDKIQEVLQPNQAACDDNACRFPTMTELNKVCQMPAHELASAMTSISPPLIIDVREPDEYNGELGHIVGAKLIPLKELAQRVGELEAYKNRSIVAVCRAGVRSTTAAAILTGLGFEPVSNLKGGMLEWNEQELPVER